MNIATIYAIDIQRLHCSETHLCSRSRTFVERIVSARRILQPVHWTTAGALSLCNYLYSSCDPSQSYRSYFLLLSQLPNEGPRTFGRSVKCFVMLLLAGSLHGAVSTAFAPLTLFIYASWPISHQSISLVLAGY